MGALNPSTWEGVSAGVIALVLAIAGIVAISRGWIVPGAAHREIVALKDATIARDAERESEHLSIMRKQAETIAEQKALSRTSEHLLEAVRDIARGREVS